MLNTLMGWVKSIGQSDEKSVAVETRQAEPHMFQDIIDHASGNMFFFIQAEGNDGLLLRTSESAYASKDSVKLAIKEMRIAKKFVSLQKKLVQEQLQNMRLNHRQGVANRGPAFRGGGKVGSFFRAVDAANRANVRADHANSTRPYENYIQYIDQILTSIDRAIIQTEMKSISL